MKNPVIYYSIADMYGTDLSSTKIANDLRLDILDQIDFGFKVEMDFKEVRSITSGWARNCIGLIVKHYGEDFVKNNIVIVNMSNSIRITMLEGIEEVLV